MKYLVIIPARGGSKGIPGKNIKPLNGKPLIYYTIDVARKIAHDDDICVTTDDDKIIKCVEEYGLKVPFKRPAELASDHAGSNDVIKHALNFYEQQGKKYDCIVLLQPTSPFRKREFIEEALSLYDDSLDMVVSVKETAVNPYYNCFEENLDGYLVPSKGEGKIQRRQDAPSAFEYNGSIYVINTLAFRKKGMENFSKVKKYIMNDIYSVDLDNMLDWYVAEMMLEKKYVEL